jgi:hypothetical protein
MEKTQDIAGGEFETELSELNSNAGSPRRCSVSSSSSSEQISVALPAAGSDAYKLRVPLAADEFETTLSQVSYDSEGGGRLRLALARFPRPASESFLRRTY